MLPPQSIAHRTPMPTAAGEQKFGTGQRMFRRSGRRFAEKNMRQEI
jgi:hypothetical protein